MSDLLNNLSLALIALAIAAIADVVTTKRGLKRGAREANPVVAFFMRRLGGWGWVVVKLGGTGLAAVVICAWGAVWMIWLLAGITGAVAWHNSKFGD